ncbi:MAG: T9SS type B sorting domain-containing protein [Flavobacteriaceae bacterium]
MSIVLCLFLASNIFAQSCPSLISPLNESSNIPVNTTISWDNVEGVTGYIIAIGTFSGGNDIIQSQTSINSFTPPLGLPDNTQIFVTITLFFFNLPNIQCSTQSFTTEDITVGPACTNLLSPNNNDINVNVGANITWAYITGADGYFITVGTAPGIGDIINNFDVGNTLQFNPLLDFPPLTKIFVKITPYNENGFSNTCIELSFTTGNIAALPNCSYLISPVNGETNVPLSPLLEWEPVAGAIGYKVFIGSSPFENDILEGSSFSINSTFVLNFEPNNIYFIRIVPFNDAGDAIGCSQETFSTLLGCGPYYDPISADLRTLNPEIDFPDVIELCENQIPVLINSGNNVDGHRWYFINNNADEVLISTEADVSISDIGNYKYEAYNLSAGNGMGIECSSTKDFTVELFNPPEISFVNINEINGGLYIDIEVTGNGVYEYSVFSASGPYQDSNIFTNASEATRVVYVRDKNGCGMAQFVINENKGFPKYFTPNNDGFNDVWQYSPKRDNNYTLLLISIYNRYGKLIKQINPNGQGWDGTINGERMPNSDYWYKAINSEGLIFNGHFTLKR